MNSSKGSHGAHGRTFRLLPSKLFPSTNSLPSYENLHSAGPAYPPLDPRGLRPISKLITTNTDGFQIFPQVSCIPVSQRYPNNKRDKYRISDYGTGGSERFWSRFLLRHMQQRQDYIIVPWIYRIGDWRKLWCCYIRWGSGHDVEGGGLRR